jgi:hypothetical protein
LDWVFQVTFIVDRDARRTFDPDRGYELHVVGGGSGGYVSFELETPTRKIRFTARMEGSPRPEELKILGPGFTDYPAIWVVFGLNLPEKNIIREALLTFKMSSGADFPNTKWFVRIGENGSIFDA